MLRSVLGRVRLDEPTQGSLRTRTMLSTLSFAAQGGLRFATVALVARLAGPAAVGVVSAAIAVATVLSLLWPTSAGLAASKYVAAARGAQRPHVAAAVVRFLRGRTVVAVSALAVVGFAWSASVQDDVAGGVAVAAFAVTYSGYMFLRGVQFGAGQVVRAVAWDVVSVVVALVVLAVLLILGETSTVLLLPIAAGYLVYDVAARPVVAHGSLDRTTRRQIDGFVALGVLTAIATTGFLQMSMVVAKLANSAAEAGQYAAALALATPPSLLASALSLALFPAMAELWGRGDLAGLRRQTDRAMRLMVVLLVPVFCAVAISSRFVVRVLFGARFDEAARLLPVMLVATLALSLTVVCSNSLTTRSQRGVVLVAITNAGGLAVGLIVWALFASSHSAMVVAVGYLCGTAVILAVLVAAVWRADGHRWLGLSVRTVAAVGVMLGVVALLPHVLALWWEPLISLAFIGGWLLLCGRDERVALSTVLQRRSRPG